MVHSVYLFPNFVSNPLATVLSLSIVHIVNPLQPFPPAVHFFIYCFSFYLYFSLSCMYSLTSGTYLIHNSPSLACISSPLAHTYFIFFLFSHVFSYLWHILISSFFSFRMYSPTSGTYPIHNFTLSRTCFLASGTYLFHLFSLFACIPLPPAHT